MREREIFDAALAIANPDERSAYLAQVCAGDPRIREHIEGLLDMHQQLGSFLESPAPSPVATVDEALTERPGTVIGPYKLLEQIVRGHMAPVAAVAFTPDGRRLISASGDTTVKVSDLTWLDRKLK